MSLFDGLPNNQTDLMDFSQSNINQTQKIYLKSTQVNEMLQMSSEKVILCYICKVQLISTKIIFNSCNAYCVGCFCKLESLESDYSLINLSIQSTNAKGWSVGEEIAFCNLADKYGIDNKRQFSQVLPLKKDQQSINSYIIATFTELQVQKINSKVTKEEEDENENDSLNATEEIDQRSYIKRFQKDWSQVYHDISQRICFNQYDTIEYMMSFLHEKSKPEDINFILSLKKKESILQDKIHNQLKAMSKKIVRERYSKPNSKQDHPKSQDQSSDFEYNFFNFDSLEKQENQLNISIDNYLEKIQQLCKSKTIKKEPKDKSKQKKGYSNHQIQKTRRS